MDYIIPDLTIPVIPAIPAEPPTRGMAAPPTRGLTPPTAIIPEADVPTIDLPPPTITNPDPGRPRPGSNEDLNIQQQPPPDPPRELPMAPFDASTELNVTVPIIDQELTIPVPKPEVVITAGTTAMVSAFAATGAAIFAKPLFDLIMKIAKPIAKKIAKKVLGKKEKVYPPSTECTLPDQFLFEGSRLTPLLLRQHRDRRKEKKGAEKPQPE